MTEAGGLTAFRCLGGALALGMAVAVPAAWAQPAALSVSAASLPGLYAQSFGGRYRAAPQGPAQQARALFARTFEVAARPDATAVQTLRATWSALGFELVELAGGGARMLVLVEQATRREGRGFYAFRCGGGAWSLQAPHRPSDLHTGEIVLRLFEQGPFAAAAWSTLGRRDADLAHLHDTLFTAFAQAAAARPGAHGVLQVHGFDAEARADRLPPQTHMIVSSGAKRLGGSAATLFPRLAAVQAFGARRYPDDVRTLGGVTNSSVAALREQGHESLFVHLEISLSLRERLRDDAALRRRFIEALA